MNRSTASRLFRLGEGSVYRLDKLTLAFKRDPAGELCGYSVCLAVCEAGWPGARLHRHGYEEWHIQIEGEGECRLGDDLFTLRAGDMAYVPSGVPHGFLPNGSGGTQLLISSPPGIFEGFVSEVAALQSGPPVPDIKGEIQAVSEKYGIEFLGSSWT